MEIRKQHKFLQYIRYVVQEGEMDYKMALRIVRGESDELTAEIIVELYEVIRELTTNLEKICIDNEFEKEMDNQLEKVCEATGKPIEEVIND